MPKIGTYDKYIINWGYRWIPEARTTDDEKETLNKWIVEKAELLKMAHLRASA